MEVHLGIVVKLALKLGFLLVLRFNSLNGSDEYGQPLTTKDWVRVHSLLCDIDGEVCTVLVQAVERRVKGWANFVNAVFTFCA
jgi:hypothetical protein